MLLLLLAHWQLALGQMSKLAPTTTTGPSFQPIPIQCCVDCRCTKSTMLLPLC
jgi:hypothetical protein